MMVSIVAATAMICAGWGPEDCHKTTWSSPAAIHRNAVVAMDCGGSADGALRCGTAALHRVAHATDPAVVGLPTVAPAISLLAQADPLQGTALPILPHAGPRHAGLSHGDPGVLGQLAAAPGMTAVGALAAAPARLWEALVLATDDAAPSPIARQDALLIGAALWLMTAAIFTVGLLLRRRSRARGKYRPGSGVRLRERPTDWPPTDHWDRRVHHIVPQTPTASARTLPAEEAPHPQRTSGSGSRRRRSGTRSLHRRFSYSTLD